MSDFLEFSCFGFISLAAYWLARRMQLKFSEENYTSLKLTLAIFYNLSIIVIHMDFLQNGTLPLYGHMNKAFPGWISLAMIILHAGALPYEVTKETLRSRSITQLKKTRKKNRFLFWRR
ncbi:hypothetical protein NJC38_12405 [Pseudomonas sp. 21LCFQ010]|uniref:hypothetical protein n=1 Tax=Pseudomonas sp. 21LCFQ010 TaxID=2957506 RepID=UPI002096BD10|nr:hypothetical protein [Pseudomonas sp. 21LCFQ010]MCO8162970.1 hypothetical protein [Pseudomonas sp. 21LCFQ010]